MTAVKTNLLLLNDNCISTLFRVLLGQNLLINLSQDVGYLYNTENLISSSDLSASNKLRKKPWTS